VFGFIVLVNSVNFNISCSSRGAEVCSSSQIYTLYNIYYDWNSASNGLFAVNTCTVN